VLLFLLFALQKGDINGHYYINAKNQNNKNWCRKRSHRNTLTLNHGKMDGKVITGCQ
jgi:hypothetical protein